MMAVGFRLSTVFCQRLNFLLGLYLDIMAGPLVEKLKSLELSIRKFKS